MTQESEDLFTGPFAWTVLIEAMQKTTSDGPNQLNGRANTESDSDVVAQTVPNPKCKAATGGMPEQEPSTQNTQLDQRWRILVMTQKKFVEEMPLTKNMWVAYEVCIHLREIM